MSLYKEDNILLAIDAIKLIKTITKMIKNNQYIMMTFQNTPNIPILSLDDIDEQKLLFICSVYIKIQIYIDNTIFLKYNDILIALNKYLIDLINLGINKHESINEVDGIVNSYPIYIMSVISSNSLTHSYIIGKCVSTFIKNIKPNSKFFPISIYDNMENNSTTIDKNDNETLKTYLNTNKQSHVNLLINCLIEFNKHYTTMEIYIKENNIPKEILIEIFNSAWFYILLYYLI
jgi:hypothetical protein